MSETNDVADRIDWKRTSREGNIMKNNRGLLVFASWALLLAAAGAIAHEKRISRSELPPAVQKTVDEQSRGATVHRFSKEIEDGKTYYEVELKVDGHSKDVLMDPSGS